MKFFLRVLCFLLAFIVEVKVKASDFKLIQEPKSCLLSSSVCAVKSEENRFQIRVGESSVMAKRYSIVKRLSHNELQLVKGAVLVDAAEEFYLRTAFGYALVPKEGKVLVFKKSGQFHFYPIVGDIKLFPKKGGELLLPVGFRNQLGPVVSKGFTEVGFPHAANFQTLLHYWGVLTLLDYTEFREPLEEYRLSWVEAVRKSSYLHKGLVERRIASAKERKLRRQEYLRKLKQQQNEVEDMYKRKNFYY